MNEKTKLSSTFLVPVNNIGLVGRVSDNLTGTIHDYLYQSGRYIKQSSEYRLYKKKSGELILQCKWVYTDNGEIEWKDQLTIFEE